MIDQVLVKEGQIVDAGEVLLRLNETRFKTAYEEASTQYRALLASVARLEAEVNEADVIIPPAGSEIPAAVLMAEEKLFRARRARLDAALAAVSAEIAATRPQMPEGARLIARRPGGGLESVQ